MAPHSEQMEFRNVARKRRAWRWSAVPNGRAFAKPSLAFGWLVANANRHVLRLLVMADDAGPRATHARPSAIPFKTPAHPRRTIAAMNSRYAGYLYLSLAMLGVGSTVVASRLAGDSLPPFTATALRFAIALPLFCMLMRLRRTAWPRPARRDRLLLLAQAAAGAVGYTVLLIAGTHLSSAIDAGIMLGTLPAMSTLCAALLLGERQTPRDWCAAALATAGALAVTLDGSASWSWRALAGDLLVLAAVACEAVFILLNRRLTQALAPLALSTTMAGLGLALSLVPAAFEWRAMHIAPSLGALAAITYYALVPTVLGYLLWYAGSARTSGTEAALFTALAPASAVVLAALAFAEPLGAARMAGLSLVLAGVMMGALPRRTGKAHRDNARPPDAAAHPEHGCRPATPDAQ